MKWHELDILQVTSFYRNQDKLGSYADFNYLSTCNVIFFIVAQHSCQESHRANWRWIRSNFSCGKTTKKIASGRNKQRRAQEAYNAFCWAAQWRKPVSWSSKTLSWYFIFWKTFRRQHQAGRCASGNGKLRLEEGCFLCLLLRAHLHGYMYFIIMVRTSLSFK